MKGFSRVVDISPEYFVVYFILRSVPGTSFSFVSLFLNFAT